MKTLLTLLTLFLLSIGVEATSIGVGLDWRKNVFLQEYWKDGKPRYLIANVGKEPVKVTVFEWKPAPRIAPKEQPGALILESGVVTNVKGAKLAGPWEIKGNEAVDVDASVLKELGLMQFEVGNDFLGLQAGPSEPNSKNKNVSYTYDGLNGSGGRHKDVWFEQEKWEADSEGLISVDLVLEGMKGTITFRKTKSIDQLPEAAIQDAMSATLTVQKTDKEIKIDASKPIRSAAQHRVTLKFKGPKVDAPTMVAISGWAALPSGGGFGLTRGVLVKPAK